MNICGFCCHIFNLYNNRVEIDKGKSKKLGCPSVLDLQVTHGLSWLIKHPKVLHDLILIFKL